MESNRQYSCAAKTIGKPSRIARTDASPAKSQPQVVGGRSIVRLFSVAFRSILNERIGVRGLLISYQPEAPARPRSQTTISSVASSGRERSVPRENVSFQSVLQQ